MDLLQIKRVDRLTSPRGRSYLKVLTSAGVYFAAAELEDRLRPGSLVAAETARERGVRLIRSVAEPEPARSESLPPFGDAPLPLFGDDPPPEPPRSEPPPPAEPGPPPAAPEPARSEPLLRDRPVMPLKALALEGALRLLSARGRPFDLDELLHTADRIRHWLEA